MSFMRSVRKGLKKAAGTMLGSALGGVDLTSAAGAGVVGGKVVEKIIGAPAPAIEAAKPAVMPAPNDEAIRAARRRLAIQMQARSGRQSTLLSNVETLG